MLIVLTLGRGETSDLVWMIFISRRRTAYNQCVSYADLSIAHAVSSARSPEQPEFPVSVWMADAGTLKYKATLIHFAVTEGICHVNGSILDVELL